MVAKSNRAVKSAPTSANGSNNMNPQLDINVNNLPTKEEESESSDANSEDSILSKEKR